MLLLCYKGVIKNYQASYLPIFNICLEKQVSACQYVVTIERGGLLWIILLFANVLFCSAPVLSPLNHHNNNPLL